MYWRTIFDICLNALLNLYCVVSHVFSLAAPFSNIVNTVEEKENG